MGCGGRLGPSWPSAPCAVLSTRYPGAALGPLPPGCAPGARQALRDCEVVEMRENDNISSEAGGSRHSLRRKAQRGFGLEGASGRRPDWLAPGIGLRGTTSSWRPGSGSWDPAGVLTDGTDSQKPRALPLVPGCRSIEVDSGWRAVRRGPLGSSGWGAEGVRQDHRLTTLHKAFLDSLRGFLQKAGEVPRPSRYP
jgi:hypothetical protein